MKASDLFIRCLEAEGVDYIFGIPGEETSDLIMSLLDSKIKFVLVRPEQAAAFMADMYGRLTQKVGVCLSTLGSVVRRAFKIALEEKAGAVHLELPQDIAKMESDIKPIKTQQVFRSRPNEELIEKAAKLILESKTPNTLGWKWMYKR
jgi:thiamine pyrophosphate-dependent acetolactate synthase large subunit-like protein